VGGTLYPVTLEEIIGPDAHPHQAVYQFPHYFQAIVNAPQQDRLVSYRNACPQKSIAGQSSFLRKFPGVIELGINPDRVITGQGFAQPGGYALG